MHKLKNKLSRRLVLFFASILIICLCSSALLFTSNPIIVRMQSLRPNNAALSFSEALRTNNSYEAKQLSDPILWDFIDEWTATHKVIQCSDIITQPTSSGPVSSSQIKQVSTAFVCVDQTGLVYCFSMKNIVVEENDRNRWMVTKWERVEEDQDC